MTDQSDIDQEIYQRNLEGAFIKYERMIKAACESLSDHGDDYITETMPQDKAKREHFDKCVISELKGEFVDYDQVGRNMIKAAAEFLKHVTVVD